MNRFRSLVPLAAAALVALVLLFAVTRLARWAGGPDPETIASASLQSMREQSRLTPFAARFVAVVTATQSRFGLTARKTLILPGTVRYEIDLARLKRQDLAWDAGTKTLSVRLPPLEIAGPEIDLREVREYGGGGVLSALTDAEPRLDEANRAAARGELIKQARQPMPMRLAREAARRAIERSFAMPLQAAGIDDVKVVARFPEEGTSDPSVVDRSRAVEDVLKEREQGRAR
ncbi:MAG TPA: DUF4230 domain-containing protein [Allosphingosinicella sp.]|nr:DUF4230 domain-containing protein [Allosphingosinicella sp.]